jgi:hypothetical protein
MVGCAIVTSLGRAAAYVGISAPARADDFHPPDPTAEKQNMETLGFRKLGPKLI